MLKPPTENDHAPHISKYSKEKKESNRKYVEVKVHALNQIKPHTPRLVVSFRHFL